MTNQASIVRHIRRRIATAGYSKKAIDAGIAYAISQHFGDAEEGYKLAVSRILYTDDALDDGAQYSAEPGCGAM